MKIIFIDSTPDSTRFAGKFFRLSQSKFHKANAQTTTNNWRADYIFLKLQFRIERIWPCTPKTEPGVTRVLWPEEAGKDFHETEEAQTGTDHRETEGDKGTDYSTIQINRDNK